MTLDLHWLVNGLTIIVLAGVGWFCNQIWTALQKLQADLRAFELRIAADYVRQDRLDKAMEPVLRKLDDIQSALNSKQDKP